MAELLKGKEVAAAVNERSLAKIEELKKHGIQPLAATLRVGEKSEDISYEKGVIKRCRELGVEVRQVVLPADVEKDTFYRVLDELNSDDQVHGILLFRPLPKQLDNELARQSIDPEKDIDGCTDASLAGIFTNSESGFAPCTAQAVMEILDYYGIEISGKNVTVLGRSLVIGKPVSMLMLNRNATVTICHTKTENTREKARQADILICTTGKMEFVTAAYVREGQTVIDVGIAWNEDKQKLCGDCLFEEVEPVVSKITPVPGGVGAVTNAVMVSHVVEAAWRKYRKANLSADPQQ